MKIFHQIFLLKLINLILNDCNLNNIYDFFIFSDVSPYLFVGGVKRDPSVGPRLARQDEVHPDLLPSSQGQAGLLHLQPGQRLPGLHRVFWGVGLRSGPV